MTKDYIPTACPHDVPLLSEQERDDLCLTLENDGAFYKAYMDKAKERRTHARTVIYYAMQRLGYKPSGFSQGDRELVRRYMDDRYGIKRPFEETDDTSRVVPPTRVWGKVYKPSTPEDTLEEAWPFPGPASKSAKQATPNPDGTVTVTYVTAVGGTISPNQPQPKETIMTTKFFDTKHYINGTDIDTLSTESIVGIIAAKEKKVADLKATTARPKIVEAEIAKHEKELAEFVAFLDSREG